MNNIPAKYEFVKPYLNGDFKTPFLVFSVKLAKEKYIETQRAMPWASIYYAIKANPHHSIIKAFRDLGSNFDCASIEEILYLRDLGIPGKNISFGNTIKKVSSIKAAYAEGVRMFATDCMEDLENIAAAAPKSKVYVRILVEGAAATAQWPLNRKFGTSLSYARELIKRGYRLGLDMYGISFHVGSQQLNTEAWEDPIDEAINMMKELNRSGLITMRMINLGGGLPASYDDPTHAMSTLTIDAYAEALERALAKHKDTFDFQEIVIEPGRSLVGESGVIISEIISNCKKSDAEPAWLYTDVGVFNGLVETMGESIHYPLVALPKDPLLNKKGESENYILAGPTCDSADIMYKENLKKLPAYLKGGDKLLWLSTGAYTYTYSSVNFNGFGPLGVISVPDQDSKGILP